MKKPLLPFDRAGATREADGVSGAAARRDDTLRRLRMALLEERLIVMQMSAEDTGTDPYNTGALRGSSAWGKRPR